MIRINLLPQKRARLRVATSSGASRDLIIGISSLVAAAALVFLLFDQPKRSRLRDLKDTNKQLAEQIGDKRKTLQGYDALKKEEEENNTKAAAINRLIGAQIVPANVLHELGEILTQN